MTNKEPLDIPKEMLSNDGTFEMFDDRIEGTLVEPDLEGIDPENVDMSAPGILEALVEEIKERAALATRYKHERDTAKTDTKRNVFDAKLTKNNNIAADLIVALEKIIELRAARKAVASELIETNDGEFISPSEIVAE